MALYVDPVVLTADGLEESTELKPQHPCSDVFGTHSTLGTWIGFASSLGLALLGRLRDGYVVYANNELDQLEAEVRTLTTELARLVSADAVEYYAYRLRNLSEAIRLARAVPDNRGGVSIG
jgi:hypothetical protein